MLVRPRLAHLYTLLSLSNVIDWDILTDWLTKFPFFIDLAHFHNVVISRASQKPALTLLRWVCTAWRMFFVCGLGEQRWVAARWRALWHVGCVRRHVLHRLNTSPDGYQHWQVPEWRHCIHVCRFSLWSTAELSTWSNHRPKTFAPLLGGPAESDSAYCDTCYRSMVCPSVCMCVCRLSHSCTLLKPLDGMRRHLAETLMVPSNTVLHRGPDHPREGKIWGRNSQFAVKPHIVKLYFGCCLLPAVNMTVSTSIWQNSKLLVMQEIFTLLFSRDVLKFIR